MFKSITVKYHLCSVYNKMVIFFQITIKYNIKQIFFLILDFYEYTNIDEPISIENYKNAKFFSRSICY